ncbi:hypothetical protein FJ365_05255 [Candidatus Dependentiae bacterium]|nr:hypothetical protein [Candidatus Dependentiae bacterium]
MPFILLMVVIALCSSMSVAASARRLTSLVSKYVLTPTTVWAAGYLDTEVDCVENTALAVLSAAYVQRAYNTGNTAVIKPACPVIMIKPVSSVPAFALSADALEKTLPPDFLTKTSFKALITDTKELTPLTLMRYLDICLDTYCSIYNWEWRDRGGPDGGGGRYLPPFSLEGKLAFLKQLLHKHPAAYAEAEEG